MDHAIEKAATLIEALPYMKAFTGKVQVVKVGGNILADEKAINRILVDLVFMAQVGIHPVLVHGAGPMISAAMKERGLEPTFRRGRRVTDAATLEVVFDVAVRRMNAHLCDRLRSSGGLPVACHPECERVVTAEPLVDEDGADLGFVGEVADVNVHRLQEIGRAAAIPVIAPLARDESDQVYNINADSMAARVAMNLAAVKLVLLTETPGVLEDPDDHETLVSTLRAEDLDHLIEGGVVHGGMIPKVEACAEALHGGVPKTHIIDGRLPHSLLLEIFTDEGVGTEIVGGN